MTPTNQSEGSNSTSKRKLQDSEVIDFFYKHFAEHKNFSTGRDVNIPGLGVLIPKREYKEKVKEVIKKIRKGEKIILSKKFRGISLHKLKKVVILTNREKLPKINVIKKSKKRKTMSTKVPESTGIELLENGSYPAICYGIAVIGTVKETFKSTEKRLKKIRIFWELPGEKFTFTKDDAEKTVPYTISQKFTFSDSPRGNLLKVLKPWSNGKITQDTIKDFDVATMVGKKGLLTVEQSKSKTNEKIYLNFAGIIFPPKGMAIEEPSQERFVFDIYEFDEDVFKKLPAWVMKEVAESEEFQAQKRRIEDYLDATESQTTSEDKTSEDDGW